MGQSPYGTPSLPAVWVGVGVVGKEPEAARHSLLASRLLRLSTETAPDQDPSRADYGQRVHRILQAFHAETDRALPSPYTPYALPSNTEL